MREEELNPYLRFYNKVVGAPFYPRFLCAYDHRLFYFCKGSAVVVLKDAAYRMEAGDLITVPPGLPYRLESGETAEYYLLNFDFTAEQWGTPARSPLGEAQFEEKDVFSSANLPPYGEAFVLRRCEELEPLLAEMGEDHPLLSSALLKTLLVRGMERHFSGGGLIREVCGYVSAHAEAGLTNLAVAEHFGYHPHYLNALFTEAQGVTLHRYITGERVCKAKEKLNLTEKTVAEIAREMGFKDSSYFSAFFKKAAGMTPMEYRRLCR